MGGEPFETTDDAVSGIQSLQMARAYYSLISASFLCFTASIMLSLGMSCHLSTLMVDMECKVWFCMTWGNVLHVPDLLLALGIGIFLPAALLGIYLITDRLTGHILSAIIGAATIAFVGCYSFLLDENLKRWHEKYNKAMKALHDAKVE